MLRSFPYPGGCFPNRLGAVNQQTVLDGSEPARVVIHDSDGSWAIGDGMNDPNEPGACIATHIRHAVRNNSSLEGLATMEPGYRANRDEPADSWVIQRHSYDD